MQSKGGSQSASPSPLATPQQQQQQQRSGESTPASPLPAGDSPGSSHASSKAVPIAAHHEPGSERAKHGAAEAGESPGTPFLTDLIRRSIA